MPDASPLSPDVLLLAEGTLAEFPLGVSRTRVVDPRFVLWLSDGDGPAFTVVQHLRLTPAQVEPVLEELRARISAAGRSSASWEVGASATPGDLERRLLALGLEPADDPDVLGMVFDGPPPPAVSGVQVRVAVTQADYASAEKVKAAVGWNHGDAAGQAARAARQRADDQQHGRACTYLASSDGVDVGTARLYRCRSAPVLSGACVAPDARGRGVYRSLVHARLADAAAVAVVQAGRMSAPILERLGFRTVTRVRVLVDAWPA